MLASRELFNMNIFIHIEMYGQVDSPLSVVLFNQNLQDGVQTAAGHTPLLICTQVAAFLLP